MQNCSFYSSDYSLGACSGQTLSLGFKIKNRNVAPSFGELTLREGRREELVKMHLAKCPGKEMNIKHGNTEGSCELHSSGMLVPGTPSRSRGRLPAKGLGQVKESSALGHSQCWQKDIRCCAWSWSRSRSWWNTWEPENLAAVKS